MKETVRMAEENDDFVIGFICQRKLSSNPSLLHMIPGVQFSSSGGSGDKLGQQYISPEEAVLNRKCDIVIVGRGIIESDDQVSTAIKYKQAAYDAYLKRIQHS